MRLTAGGGASPLNTYLEVSDCASFSKVKLAINGLSFTVDAEQLKKARDNALNA